MHFMRKLLIMQEKYMLKKEVYLLSRKKANPFKGIKLTPEKPHAEVTFEVATGVSVRATFNLSPHTGRLSRGTIGIWEPDTCRFKQVIKTGTHKFSGAMTKDLIIPAPADNEAQEEVIERETRLAANKLLSVFRLQVLGELRESKALINHSLAQVLELYGADYVADRSNSVEMRKIYLSQLQNLANWLGEKPLKDVKKKDLTQFCEIHKGKNGVDYISNFQSFLSNTAFRIGIEPPCKAVLDSFFQGLRREQNRDKENAPPLTDVLPGEFEAKLDKGCWDNLGDPFWGCTIVVKEGGLEILHICKLKIKDIVLGETEAEVYIIFRRDDIATYTNDYSFPLTPLGASYITRYLARLKSSCSPERMEEEKFLFAEDENGEVPLKASDVRDFIRVQLSRYLFGYAGHVALKNGTTISMGAELLRSTRKKHLLEDCRFDGDRGAIIFLLHQSLSRFVQADSYRCFTDTFGRKLLYKRLSQDRHGCQPLGTKKYSRMSNVVRENIRELHFPPKHNSCPGKDEIITFDIEGLELGDQIEVIGPEGCYVSVEAINTPGRMM